MNREECGEDKWRSFAIASENKIDQLRSMVRELREQGKRVVGYGASAKSTVWINACRFTRNQIEAIYDCTTEKLYRCIPGTDIPIAHEGAFYVDGPDYAILFSWNYTLEILQKQKKWLASGGQFILPHPDIRLIDHGKAEEYIRTNGESLLASR
jgi:methylation protein EvaC